MYTMAINLCRVILNVSFSKQFLLMQYSVLIVLPQEFIYYFPRGGGGGGAKKARLFLRGISKKA